GPRGRARRRRRRGARRAWRSGRAAGPTRAGWAPARTGRACRPTGPRAGSPCPLRPAVPAKVPGVSARSPGEDLDRPRQGDQDEAAALAAGGMLALGRGVEVVAAREAVRADLGIALEDEQLLAGRMVVRGNPGARLQAQKEGGRAGR